MSNLIETISKYSNFLQYLNEEVKKLLADLFNCEINGLEKKVTEVLKVEKAIPFEQPKVAEANNEILKSIKQICSVDLDTKKEEVIGALNEFNKRVHQKDIKNKTKIRKLEKMEQEFKELNKEFKELNTKLIEKVNFLTINQTIHSVDLYTRNARYEVHLSQPIVKALCDGDLNTYKESINNLETIQITANSLKEKLKSFPEKVKKIKVQEVMSELNKEEKELLLKVDDSKALERLEDYPTEKTN
ncbi:hypothetical protein ABK040_007217 [Willaertia magna]